MSEERKLLDTLYLLLHAMRAGDEEFYRKHVSEDLSCFEPESQGYLVDGLPFHEFFITNFKVTGPYHLELIRPTVRVFGDTGYTAYTLIVLQKPDGNPVISRVNETRVWHKEDGLWRMVHFHRSY